MTRTDPTLKTCSICYKRIDIQGNWEHGHNAHPVVVHNPTHETLVKHDRCCSHCNTHLVLPLRIMGAMGSITTADKLLRPFRHAKTQTDVIIAHMELLMKLSRSAM